MGPLEHRLELYDQIVNDKEYKQWKTDTELHLFQNRPDLISIPDLMVILASKKHQLSYMETLEYAEAIATRLANKHNDQYKALEAILFEEPPNLQVNPESLPKAKLWTPGAYIINRFNSQVEDNLNRRAFVLNPTVFVDRTHDNNGTTLTISFHKPGHLSLYTSYTINDLDIYESNCRDQVIDTVAIELFNGLEHYVTTEEYTREALKSSLEPIDFYTGVNPK